MAEAGVACDRSRRPARVPGPGVLAGGPPRLGRLGRPGPVGSTWPTSSEHSAVIQPNADPRRVQAEGRPRRARSGETVRPTCLPGCFMKQCHQLAWLHAPRSDRVACSGSSGRLRPVPVGPPHPSSPAEGPPTALGPLFFNNGLCILEAESFQGQLPPFVGRVQSRKGPGDSRVAVTPLLPQAWVWPPGWQCIAGSRAAPPWGRRSSHVSRARRGGRGRPRLSPVPCLMSGRHEERKQFHDVSPSLKF